MSPSPRRAFTLVEAIVVLAVVAVILGLLVTAVQKIRESAERLRCSNNLKQIGIAVHNLHDSNNFVPSNPGTVHEYSGTVQYQLLPYME
jgi:prepilin-type N-terminal cleavage/methylation domain-containing protein